MRCHVAGWNNNSHRLYSHGPVPGVMCLGTNRLRNRQHACRSCRRCGCAAAPHRTSRTRQRSRCPQPASPMVRTGRLAAADPRRHAGTKPLRPCGRVAVSGTRAPGFTRRRQMRLRHPGNGVCRNVPSPRPIALTAQVAWGNCCGILWNGGSAAPAGPACAVGRPGRLSHGCHRAAAWCQPLPGCRSEGVRSPTSVHQRPA